MAQWTDLDYLWQEKCDEHLEPVLRRLLEVVHPHYLEIQRRWGEAYVRWEYSQKVRREAEQNKGVWETIVETVQFAEGDRVVVAYDPTDTQPTLVGYIGHIHTVYGDGTYLVVIRDFFGPGAYLLNGVQLKKCDSAS